MKDRTEPAAADQPQVRVSYIEGEPYVNAADVLNLLYRLADRGDRTGGNFFRVVARQLGEKFAHFGNRAA